MVITSLLYFAVLRHTWGWSLLRALPILLLFLAFDLPFLGANLLKFFQGGYVPILLGIALGLTMLAWKRGGQLLAEYHRGLPSPERVISRLLERVRSRVPGTAVFMVHRPAGVSAMLLHYVSRIQTLHQTVVLLTVETEPVPVLSGARRFVVEDVGHGVWSVCARHGFMEEADVPHLLQAAVGDGLLPVSLDDVTYLLGRETFMATERGRMGRISESLFAFLVRNATPADRHFRIPPERVVELGTQVDL
jgi:KUP system potassium uptake protein